MTIAKLAQAGNVGVETVRFYQRKGLLVEPERATGRPDQARPAVFAVMTRATYAG